MHWKNISAKRGQNYFCTKSKVVMFFCDFRARFILQKKFKEKNSINIVFIDIIVKYL